MKVPKKYILWLTFFSKSRPSSVNNTQHRSIIQCLRSAGHFDREHCPRLSQRDGEGDRIVGCSDRESRGHEEEHHQGRIKKPNSDLIMDLNKIFLDLLSM